MGVETDMGQKDEERRRGADGRRQPRVIGDERKRGGKVR
jgi:hypothetical protein